MRRWTTSPRPDGPGGDRASAAREELIDLMFERVHGARITSALVSSDNLAAIPVGIRRPWGFAAYRDGLD